ncbi:MAG: GNAT family N-acetyltransferase [Syntrophales bacterium]|nr:GNAT family N-acetyltransferase [Syntrophales bacterium]
MDVKIRNARFDDLNAMAALLGELFSIEEDFAVDEQRQRRGLELIVSDCYNSHCIKVAEVDGQVVGMCTIQTLISTAEGGMVGLLEDMVVTSSFRGQGIGHLLIKHIEAWAKEHKVTRLQLLADRTNFSALDFYGAMGWDPTRLICVRRTWKH